MLRLAVVLAASLGGGVVLTACRAPRLPELRAEPAPDAERTWQAPPRCAVALRPGPVAGSEHAGVVLEVRDFETGAPLAGAQLTARGPDSLGAAVRLGGGPSGPDGRLEARDLTPGTYDLTVRRIGYGVRAHRHELQAGRRDTLVVYLRVYTVGGSQSPCAPPPERPAWTGWCAPDSPDRDYLLTWAHQFATRENERTFELPTLGEGPVILVHEEAVCRRAAAAFAAYVGDGPGAPRRSVAVIRMGRLYYVDDPFDPQYVGEWHGRPIFDRAFRHLKTIAS